MRVLFLTVSPITDVSARGIYTDLMRKFRDEGHDVHILAPLERRFGQSTTLTREHGISLLGVRTLNIQKTNSFIEKGLAMLLVDRQYLHGIGKHFPDVHFDLVIYATPPITLTATVSAMKRRHGAQTYLLLKDIFPQGAVDIGIIRQGGFMHRYFRDVEKRLFALSDAIGCMSPANVEYVLKHNPEIDPAIVHVNPNSVDPVEEPELADDERRRVRDKHGIPQDATVFLYGGNLGKPQGVDFVMDVLESNRDRDDAFFLVVGSGTEFSWMKQWFERERPANAMLMEGLPKGDYDRLVQACDVGMIFLYQRFTIPNFPSRLLSYLECKMPVIAATDQNTDIGRIMEQGGFGMWSQAGDLEAINRNIGALTADPARRLAMGLAGHRYLLDNYTVDVSYAKVVHSLR